MTQRPSRSASARIAILFGLAAVVAASAAPDGEIHEGLIYRPEGDAIVIRNGTRWDNRPLYCNERFSLVWAGEMPSLKGEMGILYAGIERGGTRLALQQFADRIGRLQRNELPHFRRGGRFNTLA